MKIQEVLVGANIKETSSGESGSSEDIEADIQDEKMVVETITSMKLTKQVFRNINRLFKNTYDKEKASKTLKNLRSAKILFLKTRLHIASAYRKL